ncbi:MAG TPA: hypothetical protein VGM10_17280 [Actinocrinis sp.]|jgi:hypothetical protein
MRSGSRPLDEAADVMMPPAVREDVSELEPVSRPAPADTVRAVVRRLARHALPLVLYAAAALYVMHGLILHPAGSAAGENTGDQITFEWMLTAVAHQVAHLHNPLFSPAGNAPYGVNLMANPSIPVYSILLTPLTLAFGAAVVLIWLLAFNLFATAAAWYWFFLRHPGPAPVPGGPGYRAVAALGGAFCGFSPAMSSHSYMHVNLSSQWLLALAADRAFALRDRRQAVRAGAALGGFVVLGVGIAEELVFVAALALAIIALIQAALRPRRAAAHLPALLRGAGAALAVATPLLAYPLWYQFRGPRSFTGWPWGGFEFSADLEAYLHYSPLAVGGDPAQIDRIAPNITEASAFVGVPVLVLLAVILIWRRRDRAIWTAAATALILAALSLGPTPAYGGHVFLQRYAPWSLVADLPGFSDALPVRLTIALFPLFGYMIVAALGRLPLTTRRTAWIAVAGVIAVLIPAIPLPVATQPRPAAPAFYADGLWRQCVPPGGTLVAFPFGSTSMRWSATAGGQFSIVGGYFFGPGTGTRAFGSPTPRPTADLLATVDLTGQVPAVTAALRAQARSDIAYWHADCVALAGVQQKMDSQANLEAADAPLMHPAADRRLLTALFGPGRLIGGVWTWSTG